MNIDLMSISGHKIYGPKGIGALYVRRRPRVRLEPLQSGGGQEVCLMFYFELDVSYFFDTVNVFFQNKKQTNASYPVHFFDRFDHFIAFASCSYWLNNYIHSRDKTCYHTVLCGAVG